MTHDHLFNRIVDELPSITGWCPVEKALDLAATVLALRPQIVVELGIWGGRSFLPMAMACRHLGSGVCVGIDPWSKQASVEGYDQANSDWWGKQDHEKVMNDFLGHVARLELGSVVQIQRKKSDEAEIPEVVDICHVDGQHSVQAVKDVLRFAPHVRPGGIVIMDDIGWTVNGVATVKPAVDLLLANGFKELYRAKLATGEEWGSFQRVNSRMAFKAR